MLNNLRDSEARFSTFPVFGDGMARIGGITSRLKCAGFMVNEISFSHGTGGEIRMDLIVSSFFECTNVP